MIIKYEGTSGRIATEEELKKIFDKKHPNSTDLDFEIWLYLGIANRAIKIITA